jgi:HD-GYP domain-containing protein (c-di-GMP phosphodiesterase class II)
MLFVKPLNLKPGMILATDLKGPQGELLLTCGHVLTASNIAKLQLAEHDGAFIVDCEADLTDDMGLLSKRLRFNAVSALKTFFDHVEGGTEDSQYSTFLSLRHYLEAIIQELIANKNALVNMADIKTFDEYTYYHCVNVSALSILQGMSAGMNQRKLYKLGMGALLHDIGKVFITKDIINKPGALTNTEYEQMKQHSALGSNYLRKQWEVPAESIVAVLTHHERYDGTGYPLHLPSSKQTQEGKIIAISDVYDALTSQRPYRVALSPSEAIEHIMGNSGLLFDPSIVSTFMKRIVPYPIGSTVRLSNGLRGVVLHNYSDGLMRPKIKVIRKNEQGDNAVHEVLDLYNDPSLLSVTVIGFEN